MSRIRSDRSARLVTWLSFALLTLFLAMPAFSATTTEVNPEESPTLPDSQAFWLDANTLAWPGAPSDARFKLHHSADASLKLLDGAIAGGESYILQVMPQGLPETLKARFPHLANATTLRLQEVSPIRIRTLLKGQLGLSATATNGDLSLTGIQLPGVLDDLFRYDGPLGAVFEQNIPVTRLWAPTAQSVSLLRFASPDSPATRHPMTPDPETGVWTLSGEPGWNRQAFLFEVVVYTPESGNFETNQVTDPYSLGVSSNSGRSLFINLADSELAPDGWATLGKPAFSEPEDIVIYELHLRDFSILAQDIPLNERGTFRAFRHPQSVGMQHLARLQQAGMTHVHLLPVFDIATVPEIRTEQINIDRAILEPFAPDSEQPQALVGAVRGSDGFNWGYDPWHYTVPEGSYSTNPDGVTRVIEFREMVAALNRQNLRVVMDVVYNHTHAAGRVHGSVLDQIVPGYYQRLDGNGRVETSTCCANTASEHRMMEKLMIDSVLTWAVDYKVDGFRFDLMGHHSRDNMLKLREALDQLTIEKDGVDGRAIYLYGEGWNFGEVANDARFVQARQGQLAGTNIGTFSDRLRDGARGGSHDAYPLTQGFLNGLVTDNSAHTLSTGPGLDALLQGTDWIRIGLAADLASYEFTTANGTRLRADAIDYNGMPAGYTADPAENISYVAAHDNETLFDINQMRLPIATSMDDRVRVQALGNALVLLGQGVPFIHAGQEFLRSKSLDRNSYDSGDWYNAVDWTFETDNWGHGLPLAEENATHWNIMAPRLGNPALAPSAADRRQALEDFEALLRIRQSSPLFRLRDAEAIQQHLRFHNTGPEQIPGLVVMSLSDPGSNQGGDFSHIVVLFNARPASVEFDLPELPGLMDSQMSPHPQQPERMAGQVSAGRFTVPGRSVSIFVSPRVLASDQP